MPDTRSAAKGRRSLDAPTPPAWMWILLILSGSLLVAGVAGVLAYAAEPSVPQALLIGGGSFVAVSTLLLKILTYMGGGRE